jgi:hypothetical protein
MINNINNNNNNMISNGYNKRRYRLLDQKTLVNHNAVFKLDGCLIKYANGVRWDPYHNVVANLLRTQ